MFDIKIGTLIPAAHAVKMIPQLNTIGCECYELDFGRDFAKEVDYKRFAKELEPVLEGRTISAIALYCNPIMSAEDRELIAGMIRGAGELGCSVVAGFAGGDPGKSVPDTIPAFRAAWKPLSELAEDNGVRIGFEGCGGGWNGGCHNIAYNGSAWELMFDAVPSRALGLEWEPCHALEKLADPIPQLRRWADRVVHLHGKDGTVAWDVIRDYGTDSPYGFMWNRTPGFGDTNWADVFTILLQHGFTGSCDIEGYHDPVHFDDMEWTAQATAVEYLKRCRGGKEFFEGPNEYRGYQGKRKK